MDIKVILLNHQLNISNIINQCTLAIMQTFIPLILNPNLASFLTRSA